MRAGSLRQSGMLQARSEAKDDYGGQSVVWTDVAKVRFELQSTGGHEIEVGGSSRAQATFTLTMRYRPGLAPTMRIVMGGRIFNITHISDLDERHRQLDLSVIEGASPG